MVSSTTVMLPTLYKLPPELTERIGHAIVAFSYIEFLLSNMVYDLLLLGQKEGRLAVREPRAKDRFELILDLAELREVKFEIDVNAISIALEDVERRRNYLAHGVWLQHPKTQQTFLRLTKGKWPKNHDRHAQVKRLIMPEAKEFGLPEVTQICKDTDVLAASLIDMHLEIEAQLPALIKKFQSPTLSELHSQDHTQKQQEPPPESSGG
ncbi:MAG TPA: hypothetical protein DEA55_04195 [Rhodospirillaceae bacterium]|nr:hypothetical protein [Rhodospirillaceae bacterium]